MKTVGKRRTLSHVGHQLFYAKYLNHLNIVFRSNYLTMYFNTKRLNTNSDIPSQTLRYILVFSFPLFVFLLYTHHLSMPLQAFGRILLCSFGNTRQSDKQMNPNLQENEAYPFIAFLSCVVPSLISFPIPLNEFKCISYANDSTTVYTGKWMKQIENNECQAE